MRMRGCQEDVMEQEGYSSPSSPSTVPSHPPSIDHLPPYSPPPARDSAVDPWQLQAPELEIYSPTVSTSTVITRTTFSAPLALSSTNTKMHTTAEKFRAQTVDRSQTSMAITSWATSTAESAHNEQRTGTASTSQSHTSRPPPVSVLAREVMRAPKYGGHSKREQLGSINESWGDIPGDPPRIGLFQPPPDLLDRAPSPFGGFSAQWQTQVADSSQWDRPKSSSNSAHPPYLDYGDE